MSNAAANSDASTFGNAEAIDSVRVEDFNDGTESITFPSVEKLVSATLPVESCDGLLRDLLICWQETFSLEECVIAWRAESSQVLQIASVTDSCGLERLQLQCETDLEIACHDFAGQHERLNRLQWLKFETDQNDGCWIGFDQSIQVEVPASWLRITAKLLETALLWELALNQKMLAALGEYAAGAGHEINNPLAAINGRTAQLLRDETNPQRRHLLQTIGAQTYRIRDMIGDSMLFARPPEVQPAKINLAELIASVFSKFADEFSKRDLSLWGNREADTIVEADETQLSIVIAELIRNSLNSVSDGGRVEIDCYSRNNDGTQTVILRVADNGTGFTEEEREHCFDPFYSGRQAGRGLGFGLSKCWRIIDMHQGQIVLNTIKDELTEFVITLPVSLSRV